jgi:Pyruvate/2-oxoacid:ferredoxin oxidoreductase gamma subunit
MILAAVITNAIETEGKYVLGNSAYFVKRRSEFLLEQ